MKKNCKTFKVFKKSFLKSSLCKWIMNISFIWTNAKKRYFCDFIKFYVSKLKDVRYHGKTNLIKVIKCDLLCMKVKPYFFIEFLLQLSGLSNFPNSFSDKNREILDKKVQSNRKFSHFPDDRNLFHCYNILALLSWGFHLKFIKRDWCE